MARKKPVSRKTDKSAKSALIDRICIRIASSEDGLVKILKEDEEFPSFDTFFRWIGNDTDLSDKYARAKELQSEYMESKLLDLADKSRIGRKKTIKANGDTEEVVADMVERSRLQIETRKWLMGKLRPKKYGDRIQQEVSGADGGALVVEIVRFAPDK